jgi:hypothetical protein
MPAASPAIPERSYGCTFGCGNPYDYIFISVRDGTTEFLCLPCFVRLASDIVGAVVEVTPEKEMAWLKSMSPLATTPMSGNGPKPRGRNAPATNDDPNLFEAFDGIITEDELPDEFK